MRYSLRLFTTSLILVALCNCQRPSQSAINTAPHCVQSDAAGRSAFIDLKGHTIAGPYDAAWPFADGLAAVRVGDKWGYIDTTGKFVIQPSFRDARSFSAGYAAVKDRNGWSFIRKDGQFINSARYREVTDFACGVGGVYNVPLGGYVDTSGNEVIPKKYFQINTFSEKLGAVLEASDSSTKFLNEKGEVVIECGPGVFADSFHDGLAVVSKSGRFGYIDRTGKISIPMEYDYALDFSEGRATVHSAGDPFWHVIDKSGHKVIQAQINSAKDAYFGPAHHSYHEGFLRAVTADGWSGYLDAIGNRAIALGELEDGTDFNGGLADIVAIEPIKDSLKARLYFRCIDITGKIVYTATIGERDGRRPTGK